MNNDMDNIIKRKSKKERIQKPQKPNNNLHYILQSSDDRKKTKKITKKNKNNKDDKHIEYDNSIDSMINFVINSNLSPKYVEKYETKKHKTNKHKIDKQYTKKTDKHRTDKQYIKKTDKHRTDKHRTDKHRTDKHRTDKQDTKRQYTKKTDKHRTDKQDTKRHNTKKTDKHRTDKQDTKKTIKIKNRNKERNTKVQNVNMRVQNVNVGVNNLQQKMVKTIEEPKKIEEITKEEENKKINENKDEYLLLIDEFCEIYKTTKEETIQNPKMEFRYFCYRYLEYMRTIEIPELELNKDKEAILIEYRLFPHLEFLIRNAIDKIGDDWSYSVVCGNLNYEYIIELCKKISPNIKVIKTDYDNLNQSTYSELFASIEFWNLFEGKKLLIYQEDSCIFKSNINDFLEWDYIGAPWLKTQNDNINCVGNGGFTLRTKQCMIDVINKISLKETKFNSSTITYMKNCGMTTGPEDVYFSLNMLRYGIGKVADWESASKFSTESINNIESLGGHNFWISDLNWKERLHKNIVIQFKPTHYLKDLEHRGGWRLIIENLIKSNFYNEKSEIIFFDMLERYFIWEKDYECNREWIGIVHCTQYTPDYLDIVNIQQLFYNEKFFEALKKCVLIISLSKYVGDFLTKEFNRRNIYVKIIVIKHPVDANNIIMFDYEKYSKNNNKLIIQIGQQLRKMTSIYLLKNTNKHKKVWLTGTRNFLKCETLLEKELIFLNIEKQKLKKDVEMKYIGVDEFDILLSKNIIFIDLFDASANNTILECIIRNTPIIVNKLPAVVEYLGEEYPLYFNKIEDVENIIINKNLIKSAHEYLKKMDKKEYDIEYFNKKLIQNIRKEIIKYNVKLL